MLDSNQNDEAGVAIGCPPAPLLGAHCLQGSEIHDANFSVHSDVVSFRVSTTCVLVGMFFRGNALTIASRLVVKSVYVGCMWRIASL